MSGLALELASATPEAWCREALRRLPVLLADHANCEKKAASTALALMFAYPDDRELAVTLSRLAREELGHFERVDRLMRRLGVAPVRERPGRYAGRLRAGLATRDPDRKRDLLLVAALIEARSCERFRRLAPRLAAPVADLYADLERSEARHQEVYLGLAARGLDVDALGEAQRRLDALARREAELITTPDGAFRFHSGVPAQAA
jgi:tRNA-(ms[2]io[6]A)-hydroxylase